MDDVTLIPATELTARFERRELSPVEVTEAALARIEALDHAVNAYCLVDPETTLAMARASETRWSQGQPAGPLDGVPVAVKDVFLTRGWPTLKGSSLVDRDQRWEVDAPAVAGLRRTGAVLLGKTTTPELGWKGVTDSRVYGVTGNPWDPTKTSGGSSGGSAAALVLGMGTLALGTDGGGSIRIPAGFSGHPGFKPTYGRVPLWPVSPYGTLAHAGPMARTVPDLARLLDVIAEPDARDWTALPPPPRPFAEMIRGGVEGLRIAFSVDLGFVDVDGEVAAAVEAAARRFEEMGARVDRVDPGFDDPVDIFDVLWNAGAAAATHGYTAEEKRRLDPGLGEIVEDGERYSAVDHVTAATRRGELGVHMNQFHEEYDLLLTPTLPIPAFEAGHEVPASSAARRWTSWTPFTYPFNLTQQPAASVPCGFTGGGLPIGLQIVGAKHRDALVLRAARAYEEVDPVDRRPSLLEEAGVGRPTG